MYKVGDIVKIKDFYDIALTFEGDGRTDYCRFVREMLDFCGKFAVIRKVDNDANRYQIENCNHWFVSEWFQSYSTILCTLEDICEYNEELACLFAESIFDEYGLVVNDLCRLIESDCFKDDTTYQTIKMKDVSLRIENETKGSDMWHKYAIFYKDKCLDFVCIDVIITLLCKKRA